jgi:predicted SprT family Zn-dependent metalloprotease
MKLTPSENAMALRTEKVWDEATAIYQLDNNFTVKFLSNAQTHKTARQLGGARDNSAPAGMAVYDNQTRDALVILNRRAIQQGYHHILDEVIPHEIAHIVCLAKPHFGSGHDDGWKEVCIRLGGTGQVTYDTEFDLRKDTMVRRQYIYNTKHGRVRLSEDWHKRLQAGKVFTCRDKSTIAGHDWNGGWV